MRKIGHHYGFSTRLQASIMTWGQAKKQARAESAAKRQKAEVENVVIRPAKDAEEGVNGLAEKLTPAPKLGFSTEDMAMFRLLQGTLNYFTVDHAARCRSPSVI